MKKEKSRSQRLDGVIRKRRSGSALEQKEFGKASAARRTSGVDLLLNEDYPGWLYSVKLGARAVMPVFNDINGVPYEGKLKVFAGGNVRDTIAGEIILL